MSNLREGDSGNMTGMNRPDVWHGQCIGWLMGVLSLRLEDAAAGG